MEDCSTWNASAATSSDDRIKTPTFFHGSLPATIKGVRWLVILILVLCANARAQEAAVDASELLEAAEDVVRSNPAILDRIGIDLEQATNFLNDLQAEFQGTYVYDLTAWHETALQLIPILQQYKETEDYAAWLQARLDYFDVADHLRKQEVAIRTIVVALPAPTPQVQRTAWVSVVEARPVPAPAREHLPQLKKVFLMERVPPQLVWVAEVESSFNPKARSPAGAAGLFQLMPATARSLDLSVGLLSDERLHPEKSGRAAAKYLRYLYGRFGDWRLALAAYNAGEGRVSGLLKKSKEQSFDAIAHQLPTETQMYVPKVEAVIRKREGVELAQLTMPRSTGDR
jgi:membrane-bound lytic murein transglycosylase D